MTRSSGILRIAFMVPAVVLLTSCLDMTTELTLKKDGSVLAVLQYVLDDDVASLGRGFGADEPWPLPLTERDFQTLSDEGVELISYKAGETREGQSKIRVRLRADSVEVLAAYLDLPFRLEGNAESGVFIYERKVLHPSMDEDVGFLVRKLAGDGRVSFILKPPSPPLEVSPGRRDGRRALWEFPLEELFTDEVSDVWRVSW